MKCDLCEDKASVFLTQIIDDQIRKTNLCESCAHEKGVTDPTGFALAEVLQGLSEEESPAPPPPGQHEKICSDCGFSEAQFKKVGRFGCATCYRVFRGDIESLLRPMHGAVRHTGKVPRRFSDFHVYEEKIAMLRVDMEAAIDSEDYEEAARMRDEIIAVEKDMEARAKSSDESKSSQSRPLSL